VKVAVIGAGSTYTPELVDGFARRQDVLPVDELVLHDIDPFRLERVGQLSERILIRSGFAGRLTRTLSLDEAVTGADAVLIQLRVGGQQARIVDETLPHGFGCLGQETTGPGGFAKALRTVPVVLSIADRVRELAGPDAWIVDFTNPVGIVTRSLLDAGHRAIGLCNVAIGFQRRFAEQFSVAPSDVSLDHVGLNHLTWIRGVTIGGADVLPELLSRFGEEIAERVGSPLGLMSTLGAIPSYYLRYYYARDEVLAEQLSGPSRAEEVLEIETALLEMYADPTLDVKPALLEQRGGAYYSEAAAQLVCSLVADTQDVQVVNCRNDGTIAGLSDDAVVEVPAVIGRGGARPVASAPLGAHERGLVQAVTAYEELAIEAARTGDMRAARLALLSHPLVGRWPLADDLLRALLDANRAHLSKFEQTGAW
jgi:6-phospho-beta-glucosidase